MNGQCFRGYAAILLFYIVTIAPAFAEGPFDPGFDGGGFSTYLPYYSSPRPYGITEDARGNFLVATAIKNQIAVSRHLHDGRLDLNFGNSGVASNLIYVADDDIAWATSVALDGHGRILLGGAVRGTASCEGGGTATVRDYLIIRLSNESEQGGTVDSTFGSLGAAFYGDCSHDTEGLRGLVVARDDSILAVGTASDSHGYANATIVKWDSDGTIDTSFGISGIVQYADSATESTEGMSIAIDASERLVIAAHNYHATQLSGALVRFTPEGDVDHSFGTDGVVELGQLSPDIFHSPGDLCCVRIDSKGRSVVAGRMAIKSADDTFHTVAFVARFTDSGKPDETFGQHGISTFIGEFSSVNALALDERDRPIFTGSLKYPYNAVTSPTVFQLNVDGSRNTAVGFRGEFSADFGYHAYPTTILVDSRGNIVSTAIDGDAAVLIRYDQIVADGFD